MPQPEMRDITYMSLENLKISLMSTKTSLTERNAMAIISNYLLVNGSNNLLSVYNDYYCKDNHEAVAEALMA
jgi:hypothetical protein